MPSKFIWSAGWRLRFERSGGLRGPGSLVAALGLLVCAECAVGQPVAFDQVPLVYTQSPEVFRGLFRAARTRGVEAIMLGDSQETSPGGAGRVYVPRLNYEFASRLGGVTKSPWLSVNGSYGGDSPSAKWMGAGARGDMSVSRLASAAVPPGLAPGKASLSNGHNVNANQWLGQLIALNASGSQLPSEAEVPRLDGLFPMAEDVFVEVIGATNPESGEIVVTYKPSPVESMRFYVPALASQTTSMGLAQAGPSEYRHEVIGPFALPTGMAQIQVELSGSDASRFTDILTARFVSAAPGKGWVFSDLSAGGYDANSLLIAHSDCGPALATLGADVVFIMYGANDAGAGATPERFRDRLVADITFVRRWLGAQTPVVIIADVYRAFDQANAAQCSANLDRYPWAAWAVAQQDPLVAAVNARRALDGLGWRAGSAGEFLSDNVHYTAHGAIVKARMESQLMFDAWDDTPCAPIADVASVGGADAPDGQLTGDDVLVFIEAFIHGQIAADVAKVGGGLGQDGLYTVDDLVVFMRDFFAGCP